MNKLHTKRGTNNENQVTKESKCDKMEKGKTTSTMAEELEVDITVVERIVKVEEMFVGKYDWEEVKNRIIETL